MLKLMKNDLYRSTKDISLYVAIIVFVVYTILMGLLNNMISEMANIPFSYGKDMFKNTYSLVADYGLLLPIFISTFAVKDLRFHTIKNKVAMGYKKWQVYLSGLLSAFIVGAIIIVFTSFVSLAFGCIINGYGPAASFGKELGFILLYILLSLIFHFVTISLVYLVTVLTGSTGLSITAALVLSFVFALLVVMPTMIDMNSAYDNIVSLTNYSQSASLSSTSLVSDWFVKESGIGINLFVRSVVITPVILCGINAFGMFMFNKKELK